MCQKLEKPYLYLSKKDHKGRQEYFVHLGGQEFFASLYNLDGILYIGEKCWSYKNNEELFEKGGAVVAPSPIILWEE